MAYGFMTAKNLKSFSIIKHSQLKNFGRNLQMDTDILSLEKLCQKGLLENLPSKDFLKAQMLQDIG